ncbi:hypothetical protein ES332_A06G229700v1 [Gossypium tomentosum]|uniref:Uncharacterized protein n=1 Tax=Gossypium tomentosum TaxID=34277 RepID=A0A5D2QAU9_GOSTO|nr:hypothetical protein ES332_A06G229700v1 [Gossypium tomentosum]
MAKGLPQISMPPLIDHDRTLLRARVPPTPRFHHLEYDPPPFLNTTTSLHPKNHKPSTVSVFKITQNQLNNLKAKSRERGNKTNYSTYTILAAYIWRCATKARGLSYDQPTKLHMPINGRPRLHPPINVRGQCNVFGFINSSIWKSPIRTVCKYPRTSSWNIEKDE